MPARVESLKTRWIRRLRTARSLRARDWRVFGEALFLLTRVAAANRVVSAQEMLPWATAVRAPLRDKMSDADIRRLAWLVGAAANYHPLRPRCLARSIALARLLGRRGVASDVRIGVRVDSGILAAHAWVAVDGRVINDDARVLDRFAPFERPLGESSHA